MRGVPGVRLRTRHTHRVTLPCRKRPGWIPVIAILDSNCYPATSPTPSLERRRHSLHQTHHVPHCRRCIEAPLYGHSARSGFKPAPVGGQFAAISSRAYRFITPGVACVNYYTHCFTQKDRQYGWIQSAGKELREKPARHPRLQKALTENGDDIEKAIDYLRQKAWPPRSTNRPRDKQGLVHAYIHMGGKSVCSSKSTVKQTSSPDEF